jgi:hypothetical protein
VCRLLCPILGLAERGILPVAYAEWCGESDPIWILTTAGLYSGLPMPPREEGMPNAEPSASDDIGGGLAIRRM